MREPASGETPEKPRTWPEWRRDNRQDGVPPPKAVTPAPERRAVVQPERTPASLTLSAEKFVAYFGALGPRWGLDADACRVHALLYLRGRPTAEADIGQDLALDAARVGATLRYLADYRMIEPAGPALWRTGTDPWDMLLSGLEERRRREIGPALETLRACHEAALRENEAGDGTSARIGQLLTLVRDLAALDSQARRISPRVLRGIAGMSGRAVRLMDRAFGSRDRR